MITASPIWAIRPESIPGVLELLKAKAPSTDDISAQVGNVRQPYQNVGGIAVINIFGTMLKTTGFLGAFFSVSSTSQTRDAVMQAAVDDTVNTILLRIDSPGGSVDGLAELGDAVFAARDQKPVVAQVDGMAASAAYYVASQATTIYLGRMDTVGSIGVRMLLYDFSEQFTADGVRAVVIDTGQFKSAGAVGTKITADQEAEFQRTVDVYFEDFVAAVARGRGVADAKVRQSAEGQMFLGKDVIDRRLADGIQTFGETVNELLDAQANTNQSRANRNTLKLMALRETVL